MGAAGDFTETYLTELEALRREGHDFAQEHPGAASRLRLTEGETPDPHVERLVESFAFLAARVRRKLDDEFSEVSDALLGVLHPHLVAPIPSMAIVEMELDIEQNLPTSGFRIERDAPLVARAIDSSADGDRPPLRFRATSPTTLWPIRIADARIEAPDPGTLDQYPDVRRVLRLSLEANGEHAFGQMELDSLRFFLRGGSRLVYELHEVLCSRILGVDVLAEGTLRSRLDPDAVAAAGLAEEDAALPYPRRSFSGYRLLQEYFAFPQKFHFIEVSGLGGLGETTRHVELAFALGRELRVSETEVRADAFSLSCVPIINLFRAPADPIDSSRHRSSYPLTADATRPTDFEVHGIETVKLLPTGGGDPIPVAPFFSLQHGASQEQGDLYWQASRRDSGRKGDRGTEMHLSLADLDPDRKAAREGLLHVELLCTNRDLPASVTGWGSRDDFRLERRTGIAGIRCLHNPTGSLRASLGGASQWKLISQLSLNYLSLVQEGRAALQEILRIYDLHATPATQDQIEGILDVRSEAATERLDTERGSGLCRGTRTVLRLDRDRFVGASPFLFASILERFLALYCSVNSFSQLALETPQDGGEVYRWPPRSGNTPVL